jgi:hypothetical protein
MTGDGEQPTGASDMLPVKMLGHLWLCPKSSLMTMIDVGFLARLDLLTAHGPSTMVMWDNIRVIVVSQLSQEHVASADRPYTDRSTGIAERL